MLTSMSELVICAVPYVDTVDPIMAPAVLKAALAKEGITSTAIDINIDIVNMLSEHPRKKHLLDFFFSQHIHPDVVDDIVEIVDYCSDQIIKHRTPIVALSLLTYSCQIFTRWLCAAIKHKHQCKIVIGGAGIKNFIAGDQEDFCQQLKDLGLIDDFISGDGEISLVKYCQGDLSYSGINTWTWQPVGDLNSLPYPDYSNYTFDSYQRPLIPICDSRGCVRNCEFCDVIEYWKKFQFRTAENIFSEMVEQSQKYNIYHFDLRSSLTNGNLKEFKRLVDLIYLHNTNSPKEKQFSWAGYFIIRPASQHPEDLWVKLKGSNAKLMIGIESVVPQVRHRMGKHFDNEDIDYHLEMAQRYNVPLSLLMIVGYPTETLSDYEFTKQWFRDRKHYAKNSVVWVNLSFASILPGTQLSRNSQDLSIKKGKLPSIWINQVLNISIEQRKQYLLELQKICSTECGFTVGTNEETLEHTSNDLH